MNTLDRLDALRQQQSELDQLERGLSPDERGLTRKALSAGIDQTQAMITGGLAAGADIVGANKLKDSFTDSMVENLGEAGRASQGIVTDITQAESMGDYAEWAWYTLVSQAPNMAAMIGGGGVTGAAGGMIAKQAAKKALQEEIREKASARVATGMAEKKALQEATTEVTANAVKKGQITGFTLPSTQLSTGEIYSSIDRETGQSEGGKAAIAGAVAGLLDTVPLFMIARRSGIAPDVVRQGIMAHVKPAGMAALKQAGAEGLTETAQTVIEHAAVDWVEGNLDLFAEENIDELINAASSGILMGVVMGGAGSAATSVRNSMRRAADTSPIDTQALALLDPEADLPSTLEPELLSSAENAVKAQQEQIRERAKYLATQGDQAAVATARGEIRQLSARLEQIRALPAPEETQDGESSQQENKFALPDQSSVEADLQAQARPISGEVIRAGNDKPWKTEKAATRALQRGDLEESQYEVTQMEDGYVLQRIANDRREARNSDEELVQTDATINTIDATVEPVQRPEIATKQGAATKPELEAKSATKPEQPKLTPKERAQQRRQVDPRNDDLITAISKLGGIDTEIESGFDGRLSHLKTPVGMPNLERPGKADANSLDDLGEKLIELGYIQPTGQGNGVDVRIVEDLVERAASGERILSAHAQLEEEFDQAGLDDFLNAYPEYENSYMDSVEREELPKSYYAEGVRAEGRALTEMAADLKRLGIPAESVTKLIRDLGNEGMDTVGIIRELFSLAEARREQQKEGTEQGSDSDSRSSGEEDGLLDSYSEADIAERENADKQRKADEREAESRAEQDAKVDDFKLTGSDREADKAAAAGQRELVENEPAESTPAESTPPDTELDLNTPEGLIQAAIDKGARDVADVRSHVRGWNQVGQKLGKPAVEVTNRQIRKALGLKPSKAQAEKETSTKPIKEKFLTEAGINGKDYAEFREILTKAGFGDRVKSRKQADQEELARLYDKYRWKTPTDSELKGFASKSEDVFQFEDALLDAGYSGYALHTTQDRLGKLFDSYKAEIETKKPPAKKKAASKKKATSKKKPSKKPSEWGQKNTVVTKDRMDELRDKLKSKLGNINAGLDPETLLIAIELSAGHIEAGARKFTDFARSMLDDLGEPIRPYLRQLYENVRYSAEYDFDDMSTVEEANEQQAEVDSYAPDSDTDLEQDSQDTATGDREVPDNDADGRSDSASDAGRGSERDGEARNTAEGDTRVSGSGPTSTGTRGNSGVRGGRRGGASSGSNSSRSSQSGNRRIPPDRKTSKSPSKIAGDKHKLLTENSQKQAAVESAKSVDADIENIRQTLPALLPEQQEDVLFAEERLLTAEKNGVMFTNGTGTGKTYTGLGIAKRFARKGQDNILIVVPSDKIAHDWIKSAKDVLLDVKSLQNTKDNGGSGIVVTTYANMGQNSSLLDREWDLLLMDESHKLDQKKTGGETLAKTALRALSNHPAGAYTRAKHNNREEAQAIVDKINKEINRTSHLYDLFAETERHATEKYRGEAEQLANKIRAEAKEIEQNAERKKVTFLSATPFAYAPNIDYAEGYLFDYPAETQGGYNHASGYDAFMVEHFGMRMRYNKLTRSESSVDNALMERQFNQFLKDEGALRGRRLEVDADYSREFVLIENEIGNKIDKALEHLQSEKTDDGYHYYPDLAPLILKRFNYLDRLKLLEAIKARDVVPRIQQHIALGRKVVLFHSYNVGGSVHPFKGTIADALASNQPELRQQAKHFVSAMPDVMDMDLGNLLSPINQMKASFPNALFVNGTVPKKARREAADQFNDDKNLDANLIVMQLDAGKEGISLHDTTGVSQRVYINVGLPTKPTDAIQAEGRPYRTGQISNVPMEYMTVGTGWERWAFASTVAQRSDTAENLSLGNEARDMLSAFVDAYEGMNSDPPSLEQGVGGKEKDRNKSTLTQFEIAKTHYFGNQKKTSRTKSQEGSDYFATPEPVGLVMVGLARLNANDKALEPSGGHGAIARYFPENTRNTFVEPSGELLSRLMLRTQGRHLQTNFEDHNLVNKYDAIVMNPPFGMGGALAIKHIDKAFKHLRDGGRIVAIFPEGPAADKKFDKWYEAEDNARVMADFGMPQALFERAGTSAKTRLLVIDKATENAEAAIPMQRWDIEADTIGELFDKVENLTSPKRPEVKESDPRQETLDAIAAGEITLEQYNLEWDDVLRGVSGKGTFKHKGTLRKLGGTWNGSGKFWQMPPTVKPEDILVEIEHPAPEATENATYASTLAELELELNDGLVTGEGTFQHKDTLRMLGGKWSRKEKGWKMPSNITEADILASFQSNVSEPGNDYRSTTSTVPSQVESSKRKPSAADNQLDLFSAPELSSKEATEQVRDNFKVRYASSPDGHIRVGVKQARTAEQAAHIIAPLRKEAQEQFLAIATDENHNVLEVINHTKGTLNSSLVDPIALTGALLDVEGVKNVWFAHNHPSGSRMESDADLSVNRKLEGLLKIVGLNAMGHIIARSGSDSVTLFGGAADTLGMSQDIKIKPAARTGSVPTTSRRIRYRAVKELKRQPISNPTQAEAAINEISSDTGILLLSNQNVPVGSVTISADEAKSLRTTGQIPRLVKAFPTTNANGAIVKTNDSEAAVNLSKFLNALGGDLRVLDVILNGESTNKQGLMLEQSRGDFLSKKEGGGKGLSVGQVAKIVKRVQRRWRKSPNIRIVADASAITGLAENITSDPDFRGMYRKKDNTIFIVASNNATERHVEELLLHERQHWSTHATYGKDVVRRMQRLAELIKGGGWTLEDFIKSRDYKYDYQWYDEYFVSQGLNEKQREAKHIDELLAMMAEDKASVSGRIRRAAQSVIAAIRAWLRENGFKLLSSLPNDELVNALRQTEFATQEGNIRPIMSRADAMHKAFHGSPHKFEKFSTDAIGGGEGAQAYGWGIYFASKKGVGEFYKTALSRQGSYNGKAIRPYANDPYEVVMLYIQNEGMSKQEAQSAAIEELEGQAKTYREDGWLVEAQGLESQINKIKAMDLDKLEYSKGALYEVDLAPEQDEYLLWDEKVSEQPEKVKGFLKDAGIPVDDRSGKELYDYLRSIFSYTFLDANPDNELLAEKLANNAGIEYNSDRLKIPTDQAASMALRAIGVRGIKYLDGSSRKKGEGSYNYVIFDDNDVVIEDMFMFRQTIDQTKPAMAKFNRWIRRNFHTRGLLNEEIHRHKLDADAMKNVGESEIEALVHDLETVMTKAFAAGRYMKVPESARKNAHKYLGGDTSVNLPQEVKYVLDVMRAHLDGMSGKMMSAIVDMMQIDIAKLNATQLANFRDYVNSDGQQGSAPPRLAKNWGTWNTIKGNMGEYLNRSYRAFDDPQWMEKANANTTLIQNAEAFIAQQNSRLTPDEVTGAVQAILQDAKDSGNFVGFIAKGGKYGSKDTSFLKKRKNVPPEIRALLGEYTDVRMGYVRSASKMKWYVANHAFLMGVRRAGLGSFLFEKATGTEFVAKIAGDDSDTMNPLNGLRTTEEIKIGLEDALNRSDSSEFMRQLISANAMVKYGKTVLAPTTQARNFLSASLFTVMNGHFDWSAMKKSFRATKSDLFTKDQAWRDYLDHLIGLGVLHDSPYAGELKDAIEDFTDVDRYDQGFKAKTKLAAEYFRKLYQAGDDFWKIIGFEAELKQQLERGLSQADAEKAAAQRIRNGYPTYSMVPKGIQFVRRAPLVGTFVSFPWEIMRTTKNQFGFIRDDWQAGHKKQAAKRIAGMAITAGLSAMASKASMMAAGLSDEDDEAVRSLLPPWNRNSQLLYLLDDKGMPRFVDLSYFDPYTYLKKPISALINGNNQGLNKKLIDALNEMASPFIGVDIAAGALLEVYTNKKMSGYGQVYNEMDTPAGKSAAILDHIRKALQPGVVSNIERSWRALNDDMTNSGREYKLTDEAWALVGVRTSTLNIPQALIYKSYEFNDRIRNASSLVSRMANSPRDKSERSVRSSVEAMNRARDKAFREMHKLVTGAQSLGLSADDANQMMKVARISEVNRKAIIAGAVPQWSMSSRFGKSGIDRAAASQLDPDNRRNVLERLESRRALIQELATQ